MVKSSRKQIQPLIRQYILDCIDEGLEGEDLTTDQAKIQYLRDRFASEYSWMIQRVGKIKACREWLLGLALNVDFTYYDIEKRLATWGITEKSHPMYAEGKWLELDRYWDRLALAICRMIC